MTKTIIRISAAMLCSALIIMLFAAVSESSLTARAAVSKPVFTITTDKTLANAGEIITVSIGMENDTDSAVTSFTGELSFSGTLFKYKEYEQQITMDGKVSVVDANASTQKKLSFVYSGSDITNQRINTGENVVFIKFLFTVIAPYDTSGEFFVGTMTDCYCGTTNLGAMDVRRAGVSVRSTTTTQRTTATSAPDTPPNGVSGDVKLASLSVEGFELAPEFNPEFVAYSIVVPYETTSVRITAPPSAADSIVTGEGVKDLNVGMNSFTVTVVAANGATRNYGLIIQRQAEGEGSAQPVVTDESTTQPPTTITTVPIEPTTNPSEPITISDDAGLEDEIMQIIGIVFGEVALFFFGFLSGFFIDKNLRRKGERAVRRERYVADDDYEEFDEDEPEMYAPPQVLAPDMMFTDGGYVDPQAFAQPFGGTNMPQFVGDQLQPFPDPQFGVNPFPEQQLQPQYIDPAQLTQFNNGAPLFGDGQAQGYEAAQPQNGDVSNGGAPFFSGSNPMQ